MRATDLMSGDLFRVNKDVSFKKGTIVVVRSIDADRTLRELKGCATCVALGDSDEIQGGVWLEYLDPIFLTPEILEKLGFSRTPIDYVSAKCYTLSADKYKLTLFIEDYGKYKRWLLNVETVDAKCFNIKCNYLHQLQHALKLCGIEKEIDL